jgi:radical SAM protein with 4Fe4S-binding SPASM domain
MVKKSDVDNHKLMYHLERVFNWYKKGDCAPIYVEIGPTNRCNHKCVFCALDWVENGDVDIGKDVMTSSLQNMSEVGVKSVMFAGEGEPLLHKDIGFFVQSAKKHGMDVSITTNGSMFNSEKREECLPSLSWIRFSVDAGNPKSYSQIHRTSKSNFDRVLQNIHESIKFKEKNKLDTTIGIQSLVLPQNIAEISELTKIAKEIGVDNIQIKPYSHHPGSSNNFVIAPQEYNKLESQLAEFESEDFKVFFRRATIERLQEDVTYSKCYGLSFFALIDSKGNVIPCNLFHDNLNFTYGNLHENTFKEIWEGERRKEVLEKLEKRGVADCRKGCRLDASNKYLYRLENPHPHDNFI